MQAGTHAASLVNGVAGVVRLFGVPAPAVHRGVARAATSVEILKQESSGRAVQCRAREGSTKARSQRSDARWRRATDWRRLLEREKETTRV